MTDQPFLNEGLMHAADGARMPVAATHNSMVSSDWFRNHADIRFDPELGVLGGEDMVLFRTAEQLGLRIHFCRRRRRLRLRIGRSHHAAVPPAFQLLARNTECVTNLALGMATRPRLAFRGGRLLLTAATRPFGRLAQRRAPQWRYALALMAQSAGLILGAFGVRRAHH